MLKTIISAENLSLSLIAEDAEFGSKSGNCEDKTVERSPSKNLNKTTYYLTPIAKQAFT